VSRCFDPKFIEHEIEIIWLRNPQTMPYVREIIELFPFRARRPGKRRWFGTEPVGYARLGPSAPSKGQGLFLRRQFWLEPHDRANDPNGVYRVGVPYEAVDPLTVSPGVCGQVTGRAWGAVRKRIVA
jgi:hypothetical protein